MERHIRDVLEEEVIYDHSQFGLLNSQIDDCSGSPPLLNDEPPRKKPVNKWGKVARTAALCGAYISLGLCFSVTGPTLLYLKDQVGSTILEISYIFTARSAGTLGGAFLGGFLLDRCNPYSAFFVIIAMMAISVGAMPWCKHLWMLMASSIIVGVANGFLDTGASTLCLQLWGKDSGPYMQALHFSYAVGGSIAPLLVQAFNVETTTPNNTMSSSRHVRSVTFPLNSNESDDQISTLVSTVTQAVSQQPPALSENGFANLTIPISNSTIATSNSTNILSSNSTLNSTSGIAISPNQTAPVIDKPKKPKPVVTNGQALGDSSQFDKIPLKIETVAPVQTTTVVPNENGTTPIFAARNDTIDPSENAKAQDSNVTDKTILSSPKGLEELNINGTSNISAIGSTKNESTPLSTLQANGNVTFVQTTIPSTEVSMVTPTPLFSETPNTNVSKSDVPVESKPTETSVSNATKGSADEIFLSTASVTIATSTPSPSTTTRLPTTEAVVTSTLKSTASPTQPPTVSITNISLLIPTTTVMPIETTESSVVKSRGKYRGQQDEISSAAVPSTTSANSDSELSVIATTTNPPTHNDSEPIDRNPVKVSDYLERFGVTRMHMLYTVIAIIVLHTAFAFLFFLCSGTRNSAVVTSERHAADRKIKPFRPSAKLCFIALMFSFYLMYVGSEVIFAQFLTTFALESPLKLPTSTANYITTAFWAAFAAGRFVAIFVAHFANPTIMLIFNMGSTALGSVALCIAGQTDVSILYTGSVLVGIGMASTFATGFLWTETHLLVTNRISAAFSIASSMGEMIFPAVTGSLMESHPMSLMYLVLALTVLCAVVFLVAWYLAKPKGRNGSFSTSSSGYVLARQAEDESSQN